MGDKRDVNRLLKELNTSQNHTYEEVMNNQLPFQDILTSRRDDGSLYKTPT